MAVIGFAESVAMWERRVAPRGGADSPGHPEGEDDPPVDVAEPPVAQPGGEGGADLGSVDDRGCLGRPHGEQQDGGGCDAETHADAAID